MLKPVPKPSFGPYQAPGRRTLRADFDVFRTIYRQANSGLYHHRTKRQIDSVFVATRRQLTNHTTLLQFNRLVRQVVDYTGSVHSGTRLTGGADSLLRLGATMFPYPLKVVGEKHQLVFNSTDAPVPAGTEILRLDGRPAATVVRALLKFGATDGYNQTGKYGWMSDNFAGYYRSEFGPRPQFELTCRLPGHADTLHVTLPAVASAEAARHGQHRHSAPLDTALARRDCGLRLLPAQGTAVLTIKTFDFGDTLESVPLRRQGLLDSMFRDRSRLSHGSAAEAWYIQFLDSAFRQLRAQPAVRTLVIDVRGNGGGTDNFLRLYSYLARRPFRENRSAFTIFTQVPLPQYFVESQPGDRRRLEESLRAEFLPPQAGRYYQRAEFNPYWYPNPLAFTGQIYLLVDQAVASAASHFAADLCNDPSVVVVGEETMGGYYGHTGHRPVTYELPRTHVRLTFSIIDLEQDVRPDPHFLPHRGVIPHVELLPNLADFIANTDGVLARTLEIIRRQR